MNTSQESSAYPWWLTVLLLPFCGLLLIASGIYIVLLPQLPDVASLKHFQFKTPLQVLSRDGQLIAEYGDEHTTPLTYRQIPPMFIKAVTAAEDNHFFTHSGIDPRGLARATLELIVHGGVHLGQSGGSTITMQVAKNYFLSQERTFARKFTEILLAHEIEQSLSKQEILTLYVNKIFLGHRAYGIAAAAQVYFGKNIRDLSIDQMALIAGLPKAPSRYNPVDNAPRALERRNWILGRMRYLGSITQAQYEHAVHAPIGLNYRGTVSEVNGLYLAELVRDTLVKRYGEAIYTSGWKVYTTVDGNRQNAANLAVRDGLIDYDHRHGYRGPEARAASLADLASSHTINGLIPGLVTAVQPDHLAVTLRDGESIVIPWSGLAWARRALANGHVTYPPTRADQVAQVGDIIRCVYRDHGWELTELPKVQGLLVAIDPRDGAIQGMVGGFDFFASTFNRVLQGGRQVGSSLKPFIYAAALDHGYTPASMINDGPLSFKFGDQVWQPQNDDGEFMGPITLRRALYLSRNLVSIRLLQNLGIPTAIDYCRRFGLPADKMPRNLTLALGSADVLPLQMLTAYATFANGGHRINPYFIDHISDARGKVLFRAHPVVVCTQCAAGTPVAPRVIPANIAFEINSILRDVIVHGTGRGALAIGRSDIAGKTGTTNEARDAWFDGYSPTLAAVTWVGYDTPSPLGSGEFGGVAAVPIWNRFMAYALNGQPQVGWSKPADLNTVWLNKNTAQPTAANDPDGYTEYLPADKIPAAGGAANAASNDQLF